MKTLRAVDDGEHDERVEEREESAWSELERLHAESGPAGPLRPIGTHWDPLGLTLTVTLSESEVSWGEVSEEDISPLTRSTTLRRQRGEEGSELGERVNEGQNGVS